MEENEMYEQNTFRTNKSTVSHLTKAIREGIRQADEEGVSEKMVDDLQELLLTLQQADCQAFATDTCTLELPGNSIDQNPPILVSVQHDVFGLSCCIEPTLADAETPCGIIKNACSVNEIRATGYINYYFNFPLLTFFNSGEEDCGKKVPRIFSCSGSTCVNEIIGYQSLEDPDPCPDFCSDAVLSVAIRCAVYHASNSLAVTYIILHLLPSCTSK
ncbi:hypothetical protein GJU40_17445 [Bacillus lacus]|uniref:Uncharacterized protein n=1 Tax=Metabacillus lacus TaxID=1983721 RepID=A0A7X2J1V1_9BACI|nr:hypothetical protein [Metabacillus lacus]MRX73921.1 hypothetical protein [Metabacillus lacus]